MNGIEKARIADFVHGSDGFGNTNQASPQARLPSEPVEVHVTPRIVTRQK